MTKPTIHPASFSQKRLWFLDQLDPGLSAYNISRVIRIAGVFNIDVLQKAMQAVVERHESLRTTFATIDGEPAQVVHPAPAHFVIPTVNLEDLAQDKRQDRALAIASEEGKHPFDLTTGPLWRAKVVCLSQREYILILTLHHIIIDGWSMSVLFEELGEFYESFSSGGNPNIPEVPLQYSDFARWQQECISSDEFGRKVDFWRCALDGVPSILDLPMDRQRPPVQSHSGRQYRVTLDPKLTECLNQLSMSTRVTPFMTLLAAFQTLLWRYTGVDSFVVGIPVAGRSEVAFERLIGFFVNTLPLRADLAGNPTFRDLLQRIRCSTLDAFEHQDVPFEKIIEELQPERSLSYTPLVQVMFVFQNMPRHLPEIFGAHVEEVDIDTGLTKFDLALEIIECDGLHCTWEYNTDLFSHERIVRMTGHFESLLRGIVANPDQKLSELPLLTSAERKQIVVDWNETRANYPRETCIHEAFERQVEECADAIAVFSEEGNITFGQLNDQANALANYLCKCGIGLHARVAVFIERSPDAIVALIAVMKSGASYVPIDPAYPKHRIAFMLEDSGVTAVLTHNRLRSCLPEYQGTIVDFDRDRSVILSESCVSPRIPLHSTDPAYVIYTSGSTGTPKAVIATHRACMNRFAWMWTAYPFVADEVCAQRTSLSFVDSVWEVFGPLLQGVPLSVIPDRIVKDAQQLIWQLSIHRVTRVVLVPSLLESMLGLGSDLEALLPHLRFCICSGETLSYQLYKRFSAALPHVTLINLYGSSEVAADVTCYDTNKAKPSGVIPIGRPLANVRMYILDSHMNPVPIGVPGEIYVGGDCLALGYLNRPKVTAERFLTVRLGTDVQERLYRTGDLGCYRQDGNIEFLGRTDRQVKVRGVRIEPGEIEAALTSHPAVHQAVVIPREDEGTTHLLAFVTPVDGHTIEPSELRRYLKTRLAESMMPSAFIALTALPLTPNGKVDQRALSAPEAMQSAPDKDYVAPRNATEHKLARIWSEVLGLERIGVNDNFFELGGHSLTAVQVIARIRKSLRLEIPIRSLFEEPTLAGLAVAVEKARSGGSIVSIPILSPRLKQLRSSPLIEMKRGGPRPPLFLFPGGSGDVLGYAELPPLLDSDQSVYGLQSVGLDGKERPLEQIEKIAERFLGEIRNAQPSGPYQLAGFCIGGIVAFEVAQRLNADGDEVSFLALIETWPPSCIPAYGGSSTTLNRFSSLADALPRHVKLMLSLPPREALGYFRQKITRIRQRVMVPLHAGTSDQSAYHGELVMRANYSAASRYVPSHYPGRLQLFVPTEADVELEGDPRLAWGAFADKGCRVIRVTGNRGNLLNRPHVQVLADKLTEQLRQSQSRMALVS